MSLFYATPYSFKDIIIYSSSGNQHDTTIYEDNPMDAFRFDIVDNDDLELQHTPLALNVTIDRLKVYSTTYQDDGTYVASMFKCMIPCYKFFCKEDMYISETYDSYRNIYQTEFYMQSISLSDEDIQNFDKMMNSEIPNDVMEKIKTGIKWDIKSTKILSKMCISIDKSWIVKEKYREMTHFGHFLFNYMMRVGKHLNRESEVYVCPNCFKKLYRLTRKRNDKPIMERDIMIHNPINHNCSEEKIQPFIIDEDTYEVVKLLHEHGIEILQQHYGRHFDIKIPILEGSSHEEFMKCLSILKQQNEPQYDSFISMFELNPSYYPKAGIEISVKTRVIEELIATHGVINGRLKAIEVLMNTAKDMVEFLK